MINSTQDSTNVSYKLLSGSPPNDRTSILTSKQIIINDDYSMLNKHPVHCFYKIF